MKNILRPIAFLFALTSAASAGEPRPTISEVLYTSVNSQRCEQLRQLIKNGADINAPIGFDRMLMEGETPENSTRKPDAWPLDVAIQQSNIDLMKILLANGAKLHGTELVVAARQLSKADALTMATALLEAGADPNARSEGMTALLWAGYKGNTALAELLLAQPGIKPDEINADSGNTALLYAAAHGHTGVVELLLKAGASTRIINMHGSTAATLTQGQIDKHQAILTRLNAAAK